MGYLTSGRATADHYFEVAMRWRRLARTCFRDGATRAGRDNMREALRAWRQFKFYNARIVR
jgi:hypothetical protein